MSLAVDRSDARVMSGSQPPKTDPQGQPTDPSMEDILASIRRILNEEDAPKTDADNVLQLDVSMLVEYLPGASEEPDAPPEPDAEPVEMTADTAAPPPPVAPMSTREPGPLPAITLSAASTHDVAEATSESVGALLRRLVTERERVAVHRGGPTIEDMVREEIRPLLQAWLDANLPALVERQVRVEIERVVGRALP